MKIRSALGRVFAVLAIAGLVFAPIGRLAIAADMHATGNAMAADDVAAGAADDMPCCPGKPALQDCSKDCPLMALCVTAPLYFASQTSLIVLLSFASIVFPVHQSELVSIAQAPPRRPPKV
jgi:hypothetical protein